MNAVSHPEAVLFRAESDEQLVVRAKDGDDEALTALIQRYAPFVRMRAGAYGMKELDADDLYQEGMIALLTAVRNYCAGLNSSFRTFASVCINNKLNSALRAHMREKMPRCADIFHSASRRFQRKRSPRIRWIRNSL